MPTFATLLKKYMAQANIDAATLAQRIGLDRVPGQVPEESKEKFEKTIERWMKEIDKGGGRPELREYVQFCAEALELEPKDHDQLLVAAGFSTFATLLTQYMERETIDVATLARRLNLHEETVRSWTKERESGGKLPNARRDAVACTKKLNLNVNRCEEFIAAAGFPSFAVLLSRHVSVGNTKIIKLGQNAEIARPNLVRWMKARQQGGNTPTVRKDVERIAEALHLKQTDTNELLEAAGFTPARVLSPCVVGLPVQNLRQFFGREYELKRIADLWTRFPLQNIAVVGPKGVGKTSLLNYLYNLYRHNCHDNADQELRDGQRHDWFASLGEQRWVKVDFNDPLVWSKEGFFRHLLKELFNMQTPPNCDLFHFREIIKQHQRAPTFILLDNVDVGLSQPDLDISFWSGLRSICTNDVDGKLAFLITLPQVPEQAAQAYGKPSPFFNVFGQVLRLGPLLEDEARELLQFGASHAASLAGDDIDWILEQSGRCPMLLQKMCYCRFQALSEGKAAAVWQEECLALRTGMGDLLTCD
jgi:energy-coupling factor transporter ATP-binding protein EcfA2